MDLFSRIVERLVVRCRLSLAASDDAAALDSLAADDVVRSKTPLPLAADAVIRDDDEHVLDAAAEGGDLDLECVAKVRRRSARSSQQIDARTTRRPPPSPCLLP